MAGLKESKTEWLRNILLVSMIGLVIGLAYFAFTSGIPLPQYGPYG
jgi:hypothetical protein